MNVQIYTIRPTGDDETLAEYDGVPPNVGEVVTISSYPRLDTTWQYRVIKRILELRMMTFGVPWQAEARWACECELIVTHQ